MASDLANPRATAQTSRSQHDQYIQGQLRRIARQVKLTDLIGSLMVLFVGLFAFLLAAAVVDHWIMPLGLWGRIAAFAIMVGCVGCYLAMAVGPLLVRRINPTFAARTIEANQPSLKNSLVNFLMFRSQPASVQAAVYDELEHRAAGDLSHVDLDAIIDRSKLIVIGYVLTGVFAIAALYGVLSPKSTIQSVTRVVMPWAAIAKPSRVQITEVIPGDATVFAGRPVEVTVRIAGLRDDESARVVYTTDDGQSVDRPVELVWNSSTLRHHATLPADGDGVRQDLRYHIEAGDANSNEFKIHVQAEPTIVVERIEYDYPDYTKRPSAIVERQADVQGIEGTRVTVRATANYAIGAARLEFNPSNENGRATSYARSLPMHVDDKSAQASFTLKLDAARRLPEHRAYQVRFTTVDGQSSDHPTLHQIHVTPDLPPEIEILTPKTRRIEVPEDGRQKVEVRAIDPDYGLTRVVLKAVAGSEQLVDEELLRNFQGYVGQSVTNFIFEPAKLNLSAGSRVTFWAVAEDSRVAPGGGQPEPNSARTPEYEIVITPSKRRTTESTPGEQRSDDKHSGEPMDDGSAGGSSESDDRGGGQNGGGSRDSASSSDSASADGSSGGKSPQDNSTQEGGTDSETGANGQSGGGAGPDGGSTSDSQGTGGNSDGSSSGSTGGSSERQGSSGGTPSDSGGDGTEEQQAANAGGGSQSGKGGAGQNSPPQQPLHDGEVFEKVEQFRQQQTQNSSSGTNRGGETTDSANDETTSSSESDGDDGSQKGRSDSNHNSQAANQTGESSTRNATESTGNDAKHGSGAPNDQVAGEGGKPQGPMEAESSKPADTSPESDGGGKSGLGDNGRSGAGQRSESDQGAAQSQADNRDREKTQQPDNSAAQRGNEAQSPSNSKRQSDSEGGESGDRSGGGKQGGGQGANQKGNDSAGSNSSADEGAGASAEQGDGETGENAGDQRQADGRTGNAGQQRGAGTTAKSGEGDQTGGKPTNPQTGSNDSSAPPPNDPSKSESSPTSTGRRPGGGGLPIGGGIGGNNDGGPSNLPNEVPAGEKANLEYARKATDMTLDYLDQQKERPNPRLLDELGWTQDDLRKFVERWKRMKDSARTNDEARAELDESLRSLGLRPEAGRVRSGSVQSDNTRGLSDSGDISAPPAKYRDLFNAFKKGAARSN